MRILPLALVASALAAQDFDPGPAPTRDLFPLRLMTLGLQPISGKPVGEGRWQVAFHSTRANVFEFSDLLKADPPRSVGGRLVPDRAYWEGYAAAHPNEPFVFWFDAEIIRTTLRIRYGLGPRTDVFTEGAWESQTGGTLDSVIERFHSATGFKQFGRDLVARHQFSIATLAGGKVAFYRDSPTRRKPQDPVLGVVHQLADGLSLTATVKAPLTTTYDAYRAGWDAQLGLSGWWRGGGHREFTWGAAYTHRGKGNEAYKAVGFVDELGLHGGIRWRTASRFQPYLQLQLMSGFTGKRPGATFDRPSFQHDLGVHWRFGAATALTLRYVNNISHNENTMDMAFAAGVTARF